MQETSPIKKKRKIPYLFRRKLSCPDCGFIYNELINRPIYSDKYIDCSRCNVRLSSEEFWGENVSKWDRTADLTYEHDT